MKTCCEIELVRNSLARRFNAMPREVLPLETDNYIDTVSAGASDTQIYIPNQPNSQDTSFLGNNLKDVLFWGELHIEWVFNAVPVVVDATYYHRIQAIQEIQLDLNTYTIKQWYPFYFDTNNPAFPPFPVLLSRQPYTHGGGQFQLKYLFNGIRIVGQSAAGSDVNISAHIHFKGYEVYFR